MNEMNLLTCLVGLQATVLLAAVPWAYSVHGRLVAMESKLTANLAVEKRVTSLETRVLTIELSTLRPGTSPGT